MDSNHHHGLMLIPIPYLLKAAQRKSLNTARIRPDPVSLSVPKHCRYGAEMRAFIRYFFLCYQLFGLSGGEGGIRTHGTLAGTTVFETAPIDHSGTSPLDWLARPR